jgi:hypothetical protein
MSTLPVSSIVAGRMPLDGAEGIAVRPGDGPATAHDRPESFSDVLGAERAQARSQPVAGRRGRSTAPARSQRPIPKSRPAHLDDAAERPIKAGRRDETTASSASFEPRAHAEVASDAPTGEGHGMRSAHANGATPATPATPAADGAPATPAIPAVPANPATSASPGSAAGRSAEAASRVPTAPVASAPTDTPIPAPDVTGPPASELPSPAPAADVVDPRSRERGVAAPAGALVARAAAGPADAARPRPGRANGPTPAAAARTTEPSIADHATATPARAAVPRVSEDTRDRGAAAASGGNVTGATTRATPASAAVSASGIVAADHAGSATGDASSGSARDHDGRDGGQSASDSAGLGANRWSGRRPGVDRSDAPDPADSTSARPAADGAGANRQAVHSAERAIETVAHLVVDRPVAAAADRVLAQVVDRLRSFATDGTPGLETRFDDPQLGSLRLVVSGRAGETIQAEIVALDAKSAEAIGRAIEHAAATSTALHGIALQVRTADASGAGTGGHPGARRDADPRDGDPRHAAGRPFDGRGGAEAGDPGRRDRDGEPSFSRVAGLDPISPPRRRAGASNRPIPVGASGRSTGRPGVDVRA